MQRFISALLLLDGWRRLALAFLAGFIASFAQPPFGWFPLLWIACPILVWLLDSAALGKGIWRAMCSMAWLGGSFGLGFFVATFYWLGSALLVEADKFAWALPLAVFGLPAGLAIFWAFACGLLAWVWSERSWRIVWLALFLSGAEYLRGTILTGLPWGGFAQALTANKVMMQSLALVGEDSLNLFSILFFSLPIVFFVQGKRNRQAGRLLVMLVIVLFVGQLGYGIYRLDIGNLFPSSPSNRQGEGPSPIVRLIQPNISQAEKWKPENASWIFNRLLAMSSYSDEAKPAGIVDYVIWPESAIPFYLMEQPAALGMIVETLPRQAELITGALRRETGIHNEVNVFNAIYHLAQDGTVLNAYDKIHLVPFGEYLPFQKELEAMGFQQLLEMKGGFAQGTKRKIFTTQNFGTILPIICYEVAFSSEMRKMSRESDWIINVTNDAWFGVSSGPYQHLHLAQMRAVELGRPLVRVANTGISAIIDATGEIREKIPLSTQGVIQAKLPDMRFDTPFSCFGRLLFFAIWLIFLMIMVTFQRKVGQERDT